MYIAGGEVPFSGSVHPSADVAVGGRLPAQGIEQQTRCAACAAC